MVRKKHSQLRQPETSTRTARGSEEAHRVVGYIDVAMNTRVPATLFKNPCRAHRFMYEYCTAVFLK